MTFRDITRAVLRHKKKALCCFVATLGLVLAALVVWPRKYHSEAKLFVRLGRESVTLDPTATVGQTVSLSESREGEINSILQVIGSRGLLEQVVDRIGTEVILEASRGSAEEVAPDDWKSRLSAQLAAVKSLIPTLDPVEPREQAVTALENSIRIEAPKRSHIITISAIAASPAVAQRIVSTLIDVYREEHGRLNRNSGAYEFFTDQSELIRGQLEQVSEELRSTKNSMGLASVDSQRNILEGRISAIETERAHAESELAASREKAVEIRKLLASTPERLETDTISGYPNVAADQMRQQLYELELRQQELHAKYADTHPLVTSIDRQVENSRKIVSAQEPARTQLTNSINPIHQQLQSSLLSEDSSVTALQAQMEKLNELYAHARQDLELLNDNELKITQLQRNYELLDARYRTYVEKLEQSRIDGELEHVQISNVKVVQPASYVERPASPQKRLIAVLGVVVAALGAVGVALLFEYLDHSFRSPDEVEEQLRVPVLLTVPRLPRRHITLN